MSIFTKSNPVKDELDRRKSNTAKILEYLKEHGRATNVQLAKIGGNRFGGRLFELRAEGHLITTNHVREGLFEYIYKGNRDEIMERNAREWDEVA